MRTVPWHVLDISLMMTPKGLKLVAQWVIILSSCVLMVIKFTSYIYISDTMRCIKLRPAQVVVQLFFFFNKDISAEVNNAWSCTFTPTYTFMACRRTTYLVPLPYIDYVFIEFIDFVLLHSCIILQYMCLIKNFIFIKSVHIAAILLHDLAILVAPHRVLDADSM